MQDQERDDREHHAGDEHAVEIFEEFAHDIPLLLRPSDGHPFETGVAAILQHAGGVTTGLQLLAF
jgi:hypothetical protein